MKSLYIPDTLNSPEINFNVDQLDFEIKGQSILNDVQPFYEPVICWLEELSNEPPRNLCFTFDLNYYNLASAKRFMFIIYLLSKMKNAGSNVTIRWKFIKDDDFMREFGEDLSENFNLSFKLIPSSYYKSSARLAS